VRGRVRADKRAPGGYELEVKEIEVIQIARDYPITPKEHSVPFLMEHRHLWLRSQKQHAILQIRAETIRAIRDFFNDRGFRLMDTPILTPSACEGTTTLFETSYFDQKLISVRAGSFIMRPRRRFWQGLLFWPNFPGRKVQNQAAFNRILDGRTRGSFCHPAGHY